MESSWKPKKLTVNERRLCDELMESVKDGNLPADEYEKKVKELHQILFDPEQDYFTDLIIYYKEAYNKWQNKQGAPNSFFYEQVDAELAHLENCLIDTERIIEKESELNPNYDRTTSNPIISEMFHIDNAIRYLQSIEGELINAMGQQVQSTGLQSPETENTSIITPEQVLIYEKQALGILLLKQKIIYKPEIKKSICGKERTIPAEYWINTTFNDVKDALSALKENHEIHINDIDLFMKNHLKGKKGRDVSNSLRTEKSVKKRKNS